MNKAFNFDGNDSIRVVESSAFDLSIRITDQIIPSKGTKVGGYPYAYVDSNVESGITYYYGLEDIDFNGQSTVHWDFIDEATAK